MKPCTAAGGVLMPRNHENGPVYLIYRNGVWDLPKGKLEEGESIPECAVREVQEELGLTAPPQLRGFLCTTFHSYEEDGEMIGKTTHWYRMVRVDDGENSLKPQTEEGITDISLFPVEEALEWVAYDNLKNVLQTLRA
ncbi:MAG: NUDIX hydrolase [Balneolaceae bacterium]